MFSIFVMKHSDEMLRLKYNKKKYRTKYTIIASQTSLKLKRLKGFLATIAMLFEAFKKLNTLKNFRKELWFPNLLDRDYYDSWMKKGAYNMKKRCNEHIEEIFTQHEPDIIEEDIKMFKLLEVLSNNKIGGVPVTDKNKKLVGIVTESDLLASFLDLHIDLKVKIGLQELLN